MQPCSALAAHEPLAGTAPEVTTWLIVEQPGPWSSHAPQAIDAFAALKGSGIMPLFARRPGARRHGNRYWIARAGGVHTGHLVAPLPGSSASVAQLVELAQRADLEPNTTDPFLFICTNGARDACCATIGRRLATSLAGDESVWECTHLGGHRFAATALHLPSGNVYGRLDDQSVRHALAGEPVSLRGNSYLDRRAQAAQILGSHELVELALEDRPKSCGGEPTAATYFAIASNSSR